MENKSETNERRPLALLAVYHKEGVEDVATRLRALGYDLLASDGTAKYLLAHDIECINISDIVGEPILDHRVATLSREIHAGILADRNNPNHLKEVEDLKIRLIDLVFVTLYPLLEEIKKPEATLESVIAKTDIGGPALLRSAAKARIPVATSLIDMNNLLITLEAKNPEWLARTVSHLCARAEKVVAEYVMASAQYLASV